MAAVERLYKRGILDLPQATQAARLIAGDENLPFPPPPPPATPAVAGAPAEDASAQAVPQ